jgi:hypothetical protein
VATIESSTSLCFGDALRCTPPLRQPDAPRSAVNVSLTQPGCARQRPPFGSPQHKRVDGCSRASCRGSTLTRSKQGADSLRSPRLFASPQETGSPGIALTDLATGRGVL